MQHIELFVDIKSSPEKVFDYLTDWPAQSEWIFATRVEIRTPGLAKEVGGEIAAFTGFGPIGFWDYMTITKWEHPHIVDVIHTGRVVKGTGTMRVEKTSDTTTRFYWAEDLQIPLGLIGKIGFGILKPIFLSGVQSSLNKFARNLEARG
jgi:uncharacterized protein YndB with AHSA1/START domain